MEVSLTVETDISDIKVAIGQINTNLSNLGRNFDRALKDQEDLEGRLRDCEACVILLKGEPNGQTGIISRVAALEEKEAERKGVGRVKEIVIMAIISFLVALGVKTVG